LDFRSDNTGRAAPEIIDAIARANHDTAAGYGADEWTGTVQRRFSDLFETAVRVFPVATGTAANAISLAALGPGYGAVYCSEFAHINTSEANATGFFGGGVKLVPVPGTHGKIDANALSEALRSAGAGLTHKSQPTAVNVTQATDLGAVYSVEEVAAVGEATRAHGLKLQMDGARFANALARLGCRPAEITWKAGVDVLSFGVTKNGGLLCDAVVVFSPGIAESLAFHLRRAGQVWSKMRFAAAQLLAYVENDLWLDMAARSNAMAARIDAGVRRIPEAQLCAPVQANEVFLRMPPAALDGLARDGVLFFRRAPDVGRFVCRFDVTEREVDGLLAAIAANVSAASTRVQEPVAGA
jgi:threonine aldolase